LLRIIAGLEFADANSGQFSSRRDVTERSAAARQVALPSSTTRCSGI